jgi:hypothetical protein
MVLWFVVLFVTVATLAEGLHGVPGSKIGVVKNPLFFGIKNRGFWGVF